MTASTERSEASSGDASLPRAQGPPPTQGWGAALQIPAFRLLCVTQLASGLRQPMTFVTQAWYVNVVAPEDQRVLLLGLLATLRGSAFLAYIVFGGAFADRYPRRKMLITSHAVGFSSALLIGGLLFLSGASTGDGPWLWIMLAFFTALGLINAQDMPARNAMIADVVPNSMLTSAVTIFTMSLSVTMLVGAPSTGLLLEHFGFGTTYIVAGLGHIVIILALLRMKVSEQAADPDAARESVIANVRVGLARLRSDPVVRWIVLASWVSFTIGMSVMGLLIAAWVRDILELDATGWGAMMVFWGIGGLLASGALSLKGEFGHKGPLYLAALFVFGLAIVGFGYSRILIVAFLFNGLAGGMQQWIRILSTASLQHVVPNRVLGRVMSLLILSQGISQTFGLAIGALGQYIGLEMLYPAAGFAVIAFTILLAISQPRLRALD
ncbi:MAG TPA: MFS transporter [Dehalococcoidia bacterium]|jgi:MFS family permease|nr:MFS transporter [Dehalococcoidia bacterium]